ncbi:hypothetical protein [Piscibacillus halophilus]|uniref:hypothetical protein n=1 Tax=Piscibacillus halophilus TaxID=571933 RepID=UPI002409B985|nr:hypothetical protein [Piscibacillus halophilus]
MYYDCERIEELRKQGEEYVKKVEKREKGYRYQVNDTEIKCIHCGHDRFQKDKALLNSRGLSFFDLDWLNDSANIAVCKKCSFMHWFADPIIKIDN